MSVATALVLRAQHRVAVRAQLNVSQGQLAFTDPKIATYKDRING